MLRSALVIVLCLTVSCAVVGTGVLLGVSRTSWGREQLRDAAAQELATYTRRQVQLGPVGGDLLTGVTLRDVALADGATFRSGTVFSADEVRIRFNLFAVLRGQTSAAASIRDVTLMRPCAKFVRFRDGRTNLDDIIHPPTKPAKPEEQFRGKVFIRDGSLDLQDSKTVLRGGAPLMLRLREVQSDADFAMSGRISARVWATDGDGRLGRIWADVAVAPEHGYYSAHGLVAGLDAAYAYGVLARPSPEAQLLAGHVSGSFNVVSIPSRRGKRDSYSARISFTDARARVKWLGAEPLLAAGTATITPAGVNVERADLRWNSETAHVTGSVLRFKNPMLNLRMSASGVRLQGIQKFLSPEQRQRLASLSGLETVNLQAEVVGPVQHANLLLRAGAPGRVTFSDHSFGTVSVQNAALNLALWDTAKPALVASVKDVAVQPTDLSPLLSSIGADWPKRVTTSRITSPRVTAVMAGGKWVFGGPARVAELDADRLHITDARANFALVGDSFFLDNLTGRAMSAPITGRLVMETIPQEGRRSYVRLSVQGVDARDLDVIPLKLPRDITGLVDVNLSGSNHAKTFRGLVRLRIVGGRYKDIPFDSGAALLRIDDRDIAIVAAHVTSQDGTLWAHGNYDSSGQYAFSVTGAELDAGRLGSLARTAPLGGHVYAQAEITGRSSQWHANGDMFAFQPEYSGHGADLVAMKVTGGPKDFTVPALWLSRGSAMLRASGDVTDFAPDAPDKAGVSGRIHLAAVPVKDMLAQAGVHANADGYAEATAEVSGKLGRPLISGVATTGFATYREFEISSARAPFRLTEDALVLDDVVLQLGDARLAGGMRVDNLREKPLYAASFAATGLLLENLASLHKYGIDASGEVRVPVAEIRGTADDLTGRLRLVAPSIAYGGGSVRNADVTMTLAKDDLQLVRGEFDLIAPTPLKGAAPTPGHISASGSYNWRTKMTTAVASAERVPVGQAVKLARPVTWAFLSEGSPAEMGGGLVDELHRNRATSGGEMSDPRVVTPGVPANPGPRVTVPTTTTPATVQVPQTPEDRRAKADRTLASLGGWIGGRLTGGVSVSGLPGDLQSVFQFDVTERTHDGQPLPDLSVGDRQTGGIQADWAKRRFTNVKVEMKRGDSTVSVAGPLLDLNGQMQLTAEASALALDSIADWLPFEAQTPAVMDALQRLTGQISTLTAVARGDTHAPQVRASADITDATVAGAHFDSVSAPVISVANGGIRIDDLILKRGERQVALGIKLPFAWDGFTIPEDKPVEISLALRRTPVKLFGTLWQEYLASGRRSDDKRPPDLWAQQTEDSSGLLDANLKLVGTRKQPQLEGTLRLDKGALDIASASLPIRDMQLDLVFVPSEAGTVAQIRSGHADLSFAKLDLSGEAHLKLAPDSWNENEYDVTATIRSNPAAPAGIPAQQKPIAIAEQVSLKTQSPLDGKRFQVVRFTPLAVPASSKRLDLTGTVSLDDFRPARLAYARWDLKAAVEQGYLKLPQIFQGLLSMNLEARNPEPTEPVLISGKANISDASVGIPALGGEGQQPKGWSSSLPSPKLDVTLGVGDNVSLESSLAGMSVRIPLQPYPLAVRLIGTPQRPALAGRIESQRGWASVPVSAGSSLAAASPVGAPSPLLAFGVRINELSFVYSLGSAVRAGAGGSAPDPMPLRFNYHLWGQGERIVQGVVVEGRRIDQVRLLFTVSQDSADARKVGPTQAPPFNVTVTADPPLNQDQINRIIASQIISDPLFALAEGLKLGIFQPIEEKLRSALGLAEVSVNFQLNQPVDVQIGKYLVKNIYVSYRRTFTRGSEGYTMSVSYQLPNRMLLSVTTDDLGDHQVRIGKNWSF